IVGVLLLVPNATPGRPDDAVAKLEALGADVYHRIPFKHVYVEATPEEDAKTKVLIVSIGSKWKGGTDGLRYLEKLPALHGLNISMEGEVPKDWWRILSRIQPKEILTAGAFDDEGAAFLKNLPELDTLSLLCSKVTDRGLENLRGLRKLEYLSLIGCDIGDKGFALIPTENLRFLNLDGTRVSDKGLATLKAATRM